MDSKQYENRPSPEHTMFAVAMIDTVFEVQISSPFQHQEREWC